MKRLMVAFTVALLSVADPLLAHFIFVVPASEGDKAKVVFSETLAPDDEVEIAKIAGLKLLIREAGKDSPLSARLGKDCLEAELPGAGQRVVFGSFDFGVMQRGAGKPHLLRYHPKSIVGPWRSGAEVSEAGKGKLPAEIVPVMGEGGVRFRLLAEGKPVEGSELTVILPDGKEQKAKTDKEGMTKAFDQPGRFGVWGRHWVDASGEHAGKAYEQVRHYPTLVVDVAIR